MLIKVDRYYNEEIIKEKMLEVFQDWNIYTKWANSYKVRKEVIKRVYYL